jgi:hypothetical protein
VNRYEMSILYKIHSYQMLVDFGKVVSEEKIF